MSSQSAVTEALAVAVAAGVPVLLWGPPGTGKTSAVRALAEAAALPLETVIASIREPSDFAGLPVVVRGEDGEAQVSLAPPGWARRLTAAGRGVLFFDEVSTAPPAVQAALLRVVLERTVGDLELPEAVSVIAAANPPDQAAAGWDLSPPLANRFCHLDWTVDPRAVADGLSTGWVIPELPEVGADHERRVATARSWVGAFLRVRPDFVVAVPDDLAAAGRAWPSPRSWEMAARLLAAAASAGSDDLVRSLLARGAVGDGPGIELLSWLTDADLPDPEALLADPSSFVLPDRGDRAYAALTSVAAAVASEPTAQRWQRGWQVFARAGEAAPDIAAAAARALVRCRPPGAAVPPEVHSFLPLLREAGLV